MFALSEAESQRTCAGLKPQVTAPPHLGLLKFNLFEVVTTTGISNNRDNINNLYNGQEGC